MRTLHPQASSTAMTYSKHIVYRLINRRQSRPQPLYSLSKTLVLYTLHLQALVNSMSKLTLCRQHHRLLHIHKPWYLCHLLDFYLRRHLEPEQMDKQVYPHLLQDKTMSPARYCRP